MKFFEEDRPQVYIHGVKLRRDKKTGKRMWGLVLIVTLTPELARSCAAEIVKAWEYVGTADNAACEMLLTPVFEGATIDFFAAIDDAAPVLHLEGIDLGGFRLTRGEGGVIELWFGGEHENSAGLHAFVKEYAYTRCWAAFSPRQGELGLKPVAQGKLPK